MKEFEKDIEILEKIVQELDKGTLSLDLALSKFEQGVKLYKQCQKTLTKVEKKIKILTTELEDSTMANEADFSLITSDQNE